MKVSSVVLLLFLFYGCEPKETERVKFTTSHTNPKKFSLIQGTGYTYITYTVITPSAAPVNLGLYCHFIAGAKIYISYGDGTTELLTDGSVVHMVSAAGTYNCKIFGELDKLYHLDFAGHYLYFETECLIAAPNLTYLSCGGAPLQFKGDINFLTKLQEIWMQMPYGTDCGLQLNTINTPDLVVVEIQGMENPLITGFFENHPLMWSYCAKTNIRGDITTLVELEYFSGYCIDGGVIYGDISGLTKLWSFSVSGGNENITGDVTGLILLETLTTPPGVNPFVTVAWAPQMSQFKLPEQVGGVGGWTLTAGQINQILADFWANRNVVRLNHPSGVAAYREINLLGSLANAKPTGQGLIDMFNLMNYRTPPIPVTGAQWTIFSRQTYGVEKCLDPDINVPARWTVHGTFVVAGGKISVTHETNFSNSNPKLTLIDGRQYVIKFVVDTLTGGTLFAYLGGSVGIKPTAPGTYYALHTSAIPVDDYIYIESEGFATGSISEISVKEIT